MALQSCTVECRVPLEERRDGRDPCSMARAVYFYLLLSDSLHLEFDSHWWKRQLWYAESCPDWAVMRDAAL